MLVGSLVLTWVVVAGVLAVFTGRALAMANKSDRWHHGHREVRDLSPHGRAALVVLPTAVSTERDAA